MTDTAPLAETADVEELRGLAAIPSEDEFRRRFPDDTACRDFLFSARWPSGFKCTACGRGSFRWLTNKAFECRCRKKFSLTAGTILHGTRKKLEDWFLATWLVVREGVNASVLARRVGLTYKIGWSWAHKLRSVMGVKTTLDELSPENMAEAYASIHGGPPPKPLEVKHWAAEHGLFRWHAEREGGLGRCCERLTSRDWRSPSHGRGMRYYVANSCITVDEAVSSLKTTYFGYVSDKHLRRYLDETEFRRNHRFRAQGRVATTLVERFAASSPLPYAAIKGPKPARPVLTFKGEPLPEIAPAIV